MCCCFTKWVSQHIKDRYIKQVINVSSFISVYKRFQSFFTVMLIKILGPLFIFEDKHINKA